MYLYTREFLFLDPFPPFFTLKLCHFSANTQIISTDASNQSLEKGNIAKYSLSFQAFGFKPYYFLCHYSLEVDICVRHLQKTSILQELYIFWTCWKLKELSSNGKII